ncbi:hypothetical protein G7Y89_g12166 [Cudoniella acicularis]|uniref:2EXR domain-containing protein n=1 Tax=Cudoniella acicularis TaxID=354080 RepID=A0A8H4RBR4_9HELO|nr:hypothetical protein G7Y89_g12166 [Cudoniella acicularis]
MASRMGIGGNRPEFLLGSHNTPPPSDSSPDLPVKHFSMFPQLPAELRAKIWEKAINPRIVRCKRVNESNVFTVPSHSLPLFSVSQESREAAFLYGEYILVSKSPSHVYFSPKFDFLWFDAGWTSLIQRAPPVIQHLPGNNTTPLKQDFIDSLPSGLLNVHNIMVHPNWSNERMKPTVLFARFPQIERVLVAADEKSIGFQSKFLLGTVHDIKMYYAVVKRDGAQVTTPRIAVGCLGWTGAERKKFYHANEDSRQLVAVFEDDAAMKGYLRDLHDEEWNFTQGKFTRPRPSFLVKLQKAQEASKRRKLSNSTIESSMMATTQSTAISNSSLDSAQVSNENSGESSGTTEERQESPNELPTYQDVVNGESSTD